MIVGTAGHVDHGKTALVRALTRVDTDRLKEEKARGITIDLGFAYMAGPGGEPIGFVDVPGHERLIRTMVAGAAAVDFALIVIAGDDGPMPQTREHLEVLDLLGLRRGLVAVTKSDRIDTARRRAVAGEIAATLAAGAFATAEPLFVSALTGEGLDLLRQHLLLAAAEPSGRSSAGSFRLAVDRAFVLPGAGTVATGTALSGQVHVGDQLVVLPGAHRVRVRSVHAGNRPVAAGRAGERCALALAGIGREAIGRGSWIVAEPDVVPTPRFDAAVRLLSSAPRRLRDTVPVHLHCGASDVPGRVTLLDSDDLEPGGSALAQLVLGSALPLRHGDRFVLRDASGQRTIGGGTVIDPHAPHRKRRSPERLARLDALRPVEPAAALDRLLRLDPGFEALDAFRIARGLTAAEGEALVQAGGWDGTRAGATRFVHTRARWLAWREAVVAHLAAFHAAHPELPGLAGEALRLALAPVLERSLFAALRDRLLAEGGIALQGHWWKLPDHVAELGAEDRRIAGATLPLLAGAGFRPPRVRDVGHCIGEAESSVRRACKALVRSGELIEIAHDHFFPRAIVAEMADMAAALTQASPTGLFTAAEFRDRLDSGRKVAIQILDYFDRQGLTRRTGDLRRTVMAPALLFGATTAPRGVGALYPSRRIGGSAMAPDEKSVLDWFDEGREARLCHKPREQNPYPAGEPGHAEWERGWEEANDPDEKAKGYK